MSGLFRRKRSAEPEETVEDQDEKYLDLIACKVNDADGNHFGEVVSADRDIFIIKHGGAFYSISAESVRNKFGDLMLASNIDLPQARKRGEQWRDHGRDVIGENKFYDFTEKRRLEQERNDRILDEMAKARELALSTLPKDPEPTSDPGSASDPGAEQVSDDRIGDDGGENEEGDGSKGEVGTGDASEGENEEGDSSKGEVGTGDASEGENEEGDGSKGKVGMGDGSGGEAGEKSEEAKPVSVPAEGTADDDLSVDDEGDDPDPKDGG